MRGTSRLQTVILRHLTLHMCITLHQPHHARTRTRTCGCKDAGGAHAVEDEASQQHTADHGGSREARHSSQTGEYVRTSSKVIKRAASRSKNTAGGAGEGRGNHSPPRGSSKITFDEDVDIVDYVDEIVEHDGMFCPRSERERTTVV